MKTQTPMDSASDPKGFLIDLDYAQQLKPNLPIAQASPCITGTTLS